MKHYKERKKKLRNSPVVYEPGNNEAILYYERFPICIVKALYQDPEKDPTTWRESLKIIKLK